MRTSTASKEAQLQKEELEAQITERLEVEGQIANLGANVDGQLMQLARDGLTPDELVIRVGDADAGVEIKSEGIPQAVLTGDISQPLVHHLDQKQFSYVTSLMPASKMRSALSAYMTNNARLRNVVNELGSRQFRLERDYERIVATCAKGVMDPETFDKLVVAVDSEGQGPVDTHRMDNFLRNLETLDQ